ncbi:hypothetical protein SAMN04488096_10938 [Mesonia phycicola]|uniref:Lipoprotein n=1 Tax=Mesonia phycicola TaxID=579105 RepID=A0A1M6GZG5_9FLAO|nr:DUF6252 family protein [Mesonia phycicola]SHJ15332.1 hypothetical protein SAMN04488096_10938 [Mesonia phycicola]
MKKLTLLFLFTLILISCGDDIESNTPSIQGEVNGVFFRSNSSTAYLNADGSVTLTGNTGLDVITLKTASTDIGQYELGLGSQSEAGYQVNGLTTYATGDTGEGLIEITAFTESKLSGEFYFDAINGDTLTISKGSFFDVPLTNGTIDGGDFSCTDAALTTVVAFQAYSAVTVDDENYESVCVAYQAALESQITLCGDDSGELAAELESLDCVVE